MTSHLLRRFSASAAAAQSTELKVFRSVWGIEEFSSDPVVVFPELKRLGFAGVEGAIADMENPIEFCGSLKENELDLLASVYCSWTNYEGAWERRSVKQHLSQYRSQLEQIAALPLQPLRINAHSGCDTWTYEECLQFFTEAAVIERDLGFADKLSHETHRGRALFNPFQTSRLLEALPSLHLTADFAHWVVVAERLLDDDAWSRDVMAHCAARSRHIHARVAHPQGAQCYDPMAIEYRTELRTFERWWDLVWEAARHRGAPFTTLTPEYGPPPYLRMTQPSEEEEARPVTSLWRVVNQAAERQQNRFLAQESARLLLSPPATADASSSDAGSAAAASAAAPTAEAGAAFPIIDISPFMSPTPLSEVSAEVAAARAASASKLHWACRDMGFFYVTGHGVPQASLTALQDDTEAFFQQPRRAKEEIAISGSAEPRSGRGYQRLAENITYGSRDYHEGIDVHRELPSDHPLVQELATLSPAQYEYRAPLLASRNLWPSYPPALKGRMQSHIDSMLGVGNAVMRCMAAGLGLPEDHFTSSLVNESFWSLRSIYYPPLSDAATDASVDNVGISCGEHCDYGCVSLITTDATRGALQVKRADGQWIDADPIQGALVVNIGDMMRVFTNGLYKSTAHRVVNSSRGSRVSLPFFFEPNFDAKIEPLDVQAVRSNPNPTSETPVVYGEHLLSKVNANFVFEE